MPVRSNSLLHANEGVVGVIFALMLIPFIIVVGVAFDFSRMVQYKSNLQAAVDSAALAGAKACGAQIDDKSDTIDPAMVANAYFSNFPLPASGTRGSIGTPKCDTSTGGLSMTVTTNGATVTPTFLYELTWFGTQLFGSAFPVETTATATYPSYNLDFKLSHFNSDAYDQNTVYTYVIPAGQNTAEHPFPNPDPSTFHEKDIIYSNAPGHVNQDPPPIPINLGDEIGFALNNITAGNQNYSGNSYGGLPGSSHWFYSSSKTISQDAYPHDPSLLGTNCTLQTAKQTSVSDTPAVTKQCFTDKSALAYATPDCTSKDYGSNSYQMAFNDMGGNPDDKDYNDARFTITCPAYNANPPFLALTN